MQDRNTRNKKKCSNPKCNRLIMNNSKRGYCFLCFRLMRFKDNKPLNDSKEYSPRYNRDGNYIYYPNKFYGNKFVLSDNDLLT